MRISTTRSVALIVRVLTRRSVPADMPTIHTIAIGEFQKDFMRKMAEDNGGVFVDLGK